MMPINQLISLLQPENVQVDSFNFKLHSKVTVAILLLSSLLACHGQFFSEPIQCTDIPGVSKQVVDSYCWTHQIYLVTSKTSGHDGRDYAYPGVTAERSDVNDKRFLSYYPWVSLVLFLQALCFVLPNYLWKTILGDNISSLMQHNLKSSGSESVQRNIELDRLAKEWSNSRGAYGHLAVAYLACEALNLVNVVGQMFLIDRFLGHTFWTFGSDIIENSMMPAEVRVDVLSEVFPKMSKCSYWKYGPSGQIDQLDTLCNLPINFLNEKVYIVLWFWLVCLASMTTLYLAYLLTVILVPSLQIKIISSKLPRPANKDNVSFAVHSKKLNGVERLGDWLVLNMLFSNLDKWTNGQIVERMNQVLA